MDNTNDKTNKMDDPFKENDMKVLDQTIAGLAKKTKDKALTPEEKVRKAIRVGRIAGRILTSVIIQSALYSELDAKDEDSLKVLQRVPEFSWLGAEKVRIECLKHPNDVERLGIEVLSLMETLDKHDGQSDWEGVEVSICDKIEKNGKPFGSLMLPRLIGMLFAKREGIDEDDANSAYGLIDQFGNSLPILHMLRSMLGD